MPVYQRFVAYVYEYRKGKKEENCGYIRVEAREQQCQIELHIRCPGLPAKAPGCLYGIVRTSDGTKEILIRECETIQNGVECRVICPRENIDGKGTHLEGISGLVLLTEGGAFFGTEWDDQPIAQEEFLERLKHPDVAEDSGDVRQDELENSSEKVQHNTEISSENVQKVSGNSDRDSKSKSTAQHEPDLKIQEFSLDRSFAQPKAANRPGNSKEDSDIRAVGTSTAFRPGNVAGISPNSRPEMPPSSPEGSRPGNAAGMSPTPRPETPPGSPMDSRPGMPPGSPTGSCPETPPAPSPQLPGEPFDPFSDGSICDCRKIQLQDLRCLSPRDSGLRNNRFLMYGYQNFGYLLLGRTPGGQYILGVPGGYDQQERFMAGMFGFPYFKDSTQIRLPDGRGGFWYRLINAPDCSMGNRS